MDNVQFIILLTTMFGVVLANIGLFFWSRAESRSDNREVRSEVFALITAIQNEMKDFHGRLCGLEERKNFKERTEP